MIIDSLLNFFLVIFSLCFACFRLQLYSCYFIIFAAYCNIAVFLYNVDLQGEGVRPLLYNFRGDLKYCYIMLYVGGGLSKKSTFLCYIICGRPLN